MARKSGDKEPAPWSPVTFLIVSILIVGALLGGAILTMPKPANLTSATVQVLRDDGHGSGVVISTKGAAYIITAAHNLTLGHGAVRVEAGGKIQPAQVMWLNIESDVALLRVDDLGASQASAKLACRAPVISEPITVEGSPLSMSFVRTNGFVASDIVPTLPNWNASFAIDAAISPGNSGGPIYDAKHEVLGIAIGMQVAPDAPSPIFLGVPSLKI